MTLLPVWRPVVADPSRAALIVDFDGTLAPIVEDPATAGPDVDTVATVDRLALRLGLVAVVTGRPVEFVRRHLPDPRIVVVGQYGLEHDVGGRIVTEPRAEAYADAVAAAALDAERRWPQLRIERKGRLAVTVHWRAAPSAAPTPDAVTALAAVHGLAAVPGRMACELRPPLAVDKGSAVRELLRTVDVGTAVFAGDDHGDLAAFAALADWAAAAPGRVAVRIAVASPESPSALVERADLVVASPDDLAAELARLADSVSD